MVHKYKRTIATHGLPVRMQIEADLHGTLLRPRWGRFEIRDT